MFFIIYIYINIVQIGSKLEEILNDLITSNTLYIAEHNAVTIYNENSTINIILCIINLK